MRRFLATACIAMTIGGWAVPTASAGPSPDETVVVNFEDLFLFVRGGPADNRLTVSLDGSAGQYVIDSSLPVSAMNNCEATTATEARCSHFVDGESMRIEGRRGDDRLNVLTAGHPAAASGGPGDDRITTTVGRNKLFGEDDNDRISAGPGNDRIGGNGGRDTLLAGAGNDRVDAQDKRVDARIDCGPGKGDLAWVDINDPVARGCETISVQAEPSKLRPSSR
jgi:Ca2+-binding RTX toxin-like protein